VAKATRSHLGNTYVKAENATGILKKTGIPSAHGFTDIFSGECVYRNVGVEVGLYMKGEMTGPHSRRQCYEDQHSYISQKK
jgi:hypothetical protein